MVCNYNVTRTSFKSLGQTLGGGTGNHPFNSQVLSWDSVQKRPLPPDKGRFFAGDVAWDSTKSQVPGRCSESFFGSHLVNRPKTLFFVHEKSIQQPTHHTVDGSEIWRENQLRLVVYPFIYRFFYTSQVVFSPDF